MLLRSVGFWRIPKAPDLHSTSAGPGHPTELPLGFLNHLPPKQLLPGGLFPVFCLLHDLIQRVEELLQVPLLLHLLDLLLAGKAPEGFSGASPCSPTPGSPHGKATTSPEENKAQQSTWGGFLTAFFPYFKAYLPPSRGVFHLGLGACVHPGIPLPLFTLMEACSWATNWS